MNLSKIRLIIRERHVTLPLLRWPRFGTPGTPTVQAPGLPPAPRIQIGGRIGWIIAGVVGVSVAVVGVGVVFAVKDVVENTYSWPAPGAAYDLAQANGAMGMPLEPYEDGTQNQTLEIRLAADARLSTLTFSNLSLGKSGVTCVAIARDGGNNSGYLWVQDLIMTNVTAPTLDIANSEIAVLSISGDVDGHTWGGTISSTVTELVVSSTRGSGTFEASDSVVDRILITMLGDATIGTLKFENIACGSGSSVGWDLDYIKAGSWSQDAASKFGTGNGINSADWIMASTLSYKSATNSLVDTPISVR